jgi:site-specific recombinase XerD
MPAMTDAFKLKMEQFREKLALAGYLPRTIEDYLSDMRFFARFLDERESVRRFEDVTVEHLKAYQAWAQFEKINKGKTLSTKRVSCRLGALKTFYRIMHREGLLPAGLGESIRLPMARKHLPRHVPSEQQVRQLLEAAEPCTALSIRDRAILELLYATGIRSEELRTIKLDDYDMAENRLFITGKGAKDRIVPVGAWVAPYMQNYLEKSRPILQRAPTDLLFLSRNGRKLNRNSLWRIVDVHAQKAGLPKIMPHSLRHACATHLLHNGADIRIVQELLGHGSLSSTQIYTKVEIRQLHKAHSRCHPREQW